MIIPIAYGNTYPQNSPTLYLIEILCVTVEELVCCRSQSQKYRNRFGAHRETEFNVKIIVTKFINSTPERFSVGHLGALTCCALGLLPDSM